MQRNKDGTIQAKGQKVDGELDGYWEWYCKDRTRLRSGHFDMGEQVGEWITYDKAGRPYKVTRMKPKQKSA